VADGGLFQVLPSRSTSPFSSRCRTQSERTTARVCRAGKREQQSRSSRRGFRRRDRETFADPSAVVSDASRAGVRGRAKNDGEEQTKCPEGNLARQKDSSSEPLGSS